MAPTYSAHDLMKIAVEEHLKCTEFPRVGAVVAKHGRILSTGFRGEVGKIHAERIALEKLSEADSVGATVYTTLQPCVGMREEQVVSSCSELIIARGISAVVIGVLDPNAAIYTQGYRKLLANDVSVSFFNRKLREAVEEATFDYGAVDRVIGAGKRRVPVVGSGIEINVQFSHTDPRSIAIRWATIQFASGCVDLISGNGAVRFA
jgi:diaminohydroxyphosphoribosylaminopyrimidine deaminase/5-amino-6-(5-phosphoribosylamino)uracil reductase